MSRRDVTLDEVADLATVVAGVTDRLDPDAIADGEVKSLIEQFAAIKRRADGAVVMLARRAADVAGPGPEAEKTAADYLARTIGTSTATARRQVATSRHLASQHKTAEAVRTGRLSGEQAAVIAEVCDVDPGAQDDLIARAGEQTLHDLKRTCRDRHAQADADRETRRRRHHQRRSCTTMSETDGEWKAFLSAPADMGARFEVALRADHDAVFRDAHAAGRHEPDAAYRLDALLNLMERGAATRPASAVSTTGGHGTGEGERADLASEQPGASRVQRTGRQQTVIVNVDITALNRGRVDPGETCRIEGVGEVSLAAVKALIPAAHVSYVIRDGVDVSSVIHLGRQATAHQRTALHARGYECEVPHCRASHLLEIDHVVDWAFSRHTQLAELAWFCAAHHEEKTTGTRRLAGPPGRRRWVTATGIEISRDHPPDHPPNRPVGSPPGQPYAHLPLPRPDHPVSARRTDARAPVPRAAPTWSPPQQMTAL